MPEGRGLAAVQLGRVLGATVTAVASSAEKLEVAQANGATRLINHKAGDLRAALEEVLPRRGRRGHRSGRRQPVGAGPAGPALRGQIRYRRFRRR